MLKRVLLSLAALVILGACSASAQTPAPVCPLNGTSSTNLVCLIPQVYGPFGLGGNGTTGTTSVLLTDRHEGHFGNDFLASFAPINEAVGTQVSQLPIASPSSGITFVYDPSLKTFTPSTEESLGPILGERASTIGRNRLYVAFSYQYFDFNSIDGQDISKLHAVLEHLPILASSIPGMPFPVCQQPLPPKYAGDPCFVRDFIETTNNIDLRVHQYAIYATYGITPHLDFSVAIPFLDVRMNVTSTATIVPNSVAPPPPPPPPPDRIFHQFNPNNPALMSQCASAAAAGHACLQATFSDSGSAAGVGDIVLRGKYEVYKGERAGVALGVDVRVPSGDAVNFLGSGATGVEPFGVFSYSGRVSPHVEMGYELNGKSILAGGNLVPPPTGTTPANPKVSLPNRLIYVVGADVSIVKRLTGAFDIYGQRLFDSPQLASTSYTDLGACSDSDCTMLTPGTAGTTRANLSVKKNINFNITNASLGVKLRPVGKLVIAGNVLLKLDDGGLRARAVPLVGVSYSF